MSFVRYPLATAALGLLTALAMPGVATAGGVSAPAGNYVFSGTCSFGCTGQATGVLTGYDALSSSASSFAFSASNLTPTFSSFGPVTYAFLLDTPSDFSNLRSAGWQFVINGGAWKLQDFTGGGGTPVLAASGTAGNFVMSSPVPEPQSLALMLAGMGMVGAVVRARKKAQPQA